MSRKGEGMHLDKVTVEVMAGYHGKGGITAATMVTDKVSIKGKAVIVGLFKFIYGLICDYYVL